jgi:ribonuclease P protein component
LYLQRVGARGSGQFVTVIAKDARGRHGRVGLTVPKKVGKAHLRSLIKRRLRHILRTHKSWFEGRDLVVIARAGIDGLSFLELEADVKTAVEKAARAPRPQRKKRRR